MATTEKITSEKCWELLTRDFPELSKEIQGDKELIHLQMLEFSALTKDALRRGDVDKVRKCIAAADRIWGNATDEVLNAVSVSFLEHFDTRASYAPIFREMLTPALSEGWDQIDSYMAELLGAKWTEREIDS